MDVDDWREGREGVREEERGREGKRGREGEREREREGGRGSIYM